MMKTCFASRWEDCAQSQSVTHCMSQLSRHSTASEVMPPHSKKTVESNPCTQSLPACLELRSTACAKASMRIITHTPSCSQSSAWGTGRTPQLGRIAGTVAIQLKVQIGLMRYRRPFFSGSRQPAANQQAMPQDVQISSGFLAQGARQREPSTAACTRLSLTAIPCRMHRVSSDFCGTGPGQY